MHLSTLDVAVLVAYIILIFSIAISANMFMKKHYKLKRAEGLKPVENHYLAGKSITFWELTLSIIATEFSAMAFLVIPSYVYFENFSYLRFIIGACLSRSLISFYFLPRIYGKGLTIFEALARGIHSYPQLTKEGERGKNTFAFFYIITKIIGVSAKLAGGAILTAKFLDMPLFSAIVMISLLTFLYIVLGGLKAVVRTDMLQASIFILGGLVAHHVVGQLSQYSWGELMAYGYQNGKFSLTSSSGLLSFLYGILAGVIYDAATHGVDQDLTQKLFGAKDTATAQRGLAWSSVGSLMVNLLFLTLGVVLWAYYTRQGQQVPHPEKIFESLITNFPSPLKGLMVASILAASMSTLDSSINALSAVFWNDFLSVDRSKMYKVFINMDNFIITISIIIVSYIFSMIPGAMKFGLNFAYLSTAPLLAFFICRLLLEKYIKINFSSSVIFMSIISCFLGMALNQLRFSFNPQLTILWGLVTSMIFIWTYSKITNIFTPREKDI